MSILQIVKPSGHYNTDWFNVYNFKEGRLTKVDMKDRVNNYCSNDVVHYCDTMLVYERKDKSEPEENEMLRIEHRVCLLLNTLNYIILNTKVNEYDQLERHLARQFSKKETKAKITYLIKKENVSYKRLHVFGDCDDLCAKLELVACDLQDRFNIISDSIVLILTVLNFIANNAE